MMRKYGVENVNDHFVSFNTICDATQVILSSSLTILLVQLFIREFGETLSIREFYFMFFLLTIYRIQIPYGAVLLPSP